MNFNEKIKLVEKEVYLECENKVENNESIKVEIKGAVTNPGVYEISNSSRVIDVINMSGGLLENANTKFINLSKKITDEMVIKIYTNEEIEESSKVEVIYEYIEKECECPIISNDSCINEEEKVEDKKIININTSLKEELMNIPGIGEGKANSIIEYRMKNGNFKTIEDILNVSGIGDSVFEKIKEYITV